MAWRAFGPACSRTDDVVARNEGREVTEADEAAYVAANAAEESAFEALITLPPDRGGPARGDQLFRRVRGGLHSRRDRQIPHGAAGVAGVGVPGCFVVNAPFAPMDAADGVEIFEPYTVSTRRAGAFRRRSCAPAVPRHPANGRGRSNITSSPAFSRRRR